MEFTPLLSEAVILRSPSGHRQDVCHHTEAALETTTLFKSRRKWFVFVLVNRAAREQRGCAWIEMTELRKQSSQHTRPAQLLNRQCSLFVCVGWVQAISSLWMCCCLHPFCSLNRKTEAPYKITLRMAEEDRMGEQQRVTERVLFCSLFHCVIFYFKKIMECNNVIALRQSSWQKKRPRLESLPVQ